MKVKIIKNDPSWVWMKHKGTPIEDKINNFINNKKVIDIKINSYPDIDEDETTTIALIMYEE